MKNFILALLWAAYAFSAEEIRDQKTGNSFPRELQFTEGNESFKLNATGVATKKVLFVTAYSIAHYLQEGAPLKKSELFEEILNDRYAKQITLAWVINVKADKMTSTIPKTFAKTNSSETMDKIQNELKQYVSFFNRDVKKGDQQVVRWLPGGRIVVLINGEKVGEIENKLFARAVWNQFFAPKGEVNRDDLVSLVP